jgi:hypothetical protein
MRCCAICLVLLTTFGWGQSEKLTVGYEHGPLSRPAEETRAEKTESDTPVITIGGLCQDSSKQNAASSDCKTIITRQEFEQLLSYVRPKLAVPNRKNFAEAYAQAMVSARQAEKMGLASGPQFEALMDSQRQFLLEYLLNEALKKKADEVPDSDIEKYFTDHIANFEEIEYERLYIPLTQQFPTAGLSSSDIRKHQEEAATRMKEAADQFRARALKGEDFTSLQAEVYKLSGDAVTPQQVKVQTGKVRRNSLPVGVVSVIDLSPGEVSQVFSFSTGHFIYKVLAKRTLPVEEVKNEITEKLRAERIAQYRQEAHEAAKVTLNNEYFDAPRSSSPSD